MTTIVIAALALLVLVVLALVFTGRMGDFSTGVKEVGTCDQACIAAGYNGGEFETGVSSDCSPTETKLEGISSEGTCCCTASPTTS